MCPSVFGSAEHEQKLRSLPADAPDLSGLLGC
jgi:hypothetical protein